MPVDKRFLRMLRIGDIIVYLARPEDGPVNPNKEWRGTVLRVYMDEPRLLDHVGVESLEPGEEGLTEFVYPQQILRKECGQPTENEPTLPSPSKPPPLSFLTNDRLGRT
ncbi:MAG: hypothetical protein ACRDIV_20620 [Ktedonobacteraceae bacterium]